MNMDYRLEPPEPSREEIFIEYKVSEWLDDPVSAIEELGLDLMDYIDWHKLENDLIAEAQAIIDDVDDRFID